MSEVDLELTYATTLWVILITVDRQLNFREFEDTNYLFELGGGSRVVKLHQSYEFTLRRDSG